MKKELISVINRLDELSKLNESTERLLDATLRELKILRRSFEPFTCAPDSASGKYALNITGPDDMMTRVSEGETRPRKKSSSVVTSTKSASSNIKNIRSGVLSIDIQKGKFLHDKLINKHKLVAPYVVVKLYFNRNSRLDYHITSFEEITKFQTLKNDMPSNPQWDELFEHSFVDQDKIAFYVIGISLFYLSDKDESEWQIGGEEYFSLGSLLDQKVQNKEIEYKDPILKGILAEIRVRFQFIYDLDSVKERLLREVNARLERLYKIKAKTGTEFKDRSTIVRHSSKFSMANSMMSTSSNHDNHTNNYYFD